MPLGCALIFDRSPIWLFSSRCTRFSKVVTQNSHRPLNTFEACKRKYQSGRHDILYAQIKRGITFENEIVCSAAQGQYTIASSLGILLWQSGGHIYPCVMCCCRWLLTTPDEIKHAAQYQDQTSCLHLMWVVDMRWRERVCRWKARALVSMLWDSSRMANSGTVNNLSDSNEHSLLQLVLLSTMAGQDICTDLSHSVTLSLGEKWILSEVTST